MKTISLKFPEIIQQTDWDCGVATCLMFARFMGQPDTRPNVLRWLGADHPSPALPLRFLDRHLPSGLKGSLHPDIWAYLAQFSVIPRRIGANRIQPALKNGYPVLCLSCNCGHWCWITGISKTGWKIHCPTLGAYWSKELDGQCWELRPYLKSYRRAYIMGTREMLVSVLAEAPTLVRALGTSLRQVTAKP
jgi:hypothetical protein